LSSLLTTNINDNSGTCAMSEDKSCSMQWGLVQHTLAIKCLPLWQCPRITEALNILFRLNTQLMVLDSLHRRMVIHTLLHLILTCILHINMDLNRLMAFKLDKMAFNPDKTQGLLILDRVRVPLELICLCITCHMI
jgi:hypothetical protein